MMIEPPGNLRRRGILEIDNRVLVPGEIVFVEKGAGAMHQPVILEVGVANALAVKARKQRRRAGAIETLVVIEDLDPHRAFPVR